MTGNKTTFMYAGHICLDILPGIPVQQSLDLEKIASPGALVQVIEPIIGTGGPVSNSGIAAHIIGGQIGYTALLNGKIGDDDLGKVLQAKIAERGLDPGAMTVDGTTKTSYTVVIGFDDTNGGTRDRVFFHGPLANDTFGFEDVAWDSAGEADGIHLGYPPLMRLLYSDGGATLSKIMRYAKELGLTTSLDMAACDPNSDAGKADWDSILRMSLPSVDMFTPSIGETLYMTDRALFDELDETKTDLVDRVDGNQISSVSEKLSGYGNEIPIIVLKMGHRGVYMVTGSRESLERMGRFKPEDLDAWANRELWHTSYHAEFPMATGAGDTTIAGMHVAMHMGLSPESVLERGTLYGWQCVGAPDALGGLKPWSESTTAGLTKNPLEVKGKGWKEVGGGLYAGPRNKG